MEYYKYNSYKGVSQFMKIILFKFNFINVNFIKYVVRWFAGKA